MPTFLAGFYAPGGPLAKALGILLEKQPPPWGPTIPLGISKSYLSKNLQLGDANISGRIFALLEVSLAKAVGILLEKQPPPWEPTIPLGISKSYLSKNLQLGDANISSGFLRSWRCPLAKALGILLEKQPPPWGPTIPLGISKSYLSKNLHLGNANISGGFLRSWRCCGKSRRDFTRKTAPSLGTNDPPGNFKKLPLQKSSALGMPTFLAGF